MNENCVYESVLGVFWQVGIKILPIHQILNWQNHTHFFWQKDSEYTFDSAYNLVTPKLVYMSWCWTNQYHWMEEAGDKWWWLSMHGLTLLLWRVIWLHIPIYRQLIFWLHDPSLKVSRNWVAPVLGYGIPTFPSLTIYIVHLTSVHDFSYDECGA